MLDTRKVKALREKLGLSMEDAAQRAGLGGLREWLAVERGPLSERGEWGG